MRILRRTPTVPLLGADSLHPLLARIYAHRGVADIKSLSYSLHDLLPYSTLKGIDSAVEILGSMLISQKRFLIIGDFDADGATATAVAVRALRMLGAQHVDFLVPNRFEYGYGLTPEIVIEAAKRAPDVIITVDNGISSIEGVAKANALGIPVVVTDHHLAGKILPEAAAIVNPNQPGCPFPSKALAGVGVIFYVMLAVRAYLRDKGFFAGTHSPNLATLLDIVALGTVADVVPLDHNNRILVKQGMMRIRRGLTCAGIQALIEVSRRDAAHIHAQDFGFALGPRLNAAGRLEDMSIGIHCLLSDALAEATLLAQQLDSLNIERKTIESDMQQQAEKLLQRLPDVSHGLPRGLSLYEPSWHVGVVGILASRVKEAYHRPVICFAQGEDGLLKGSARSVTGVHIRDVLDRVSTQYPGVIKKFGGHAMAAGLTILPEYYETFSQAFAEIVAEHLSEEECQGVHWSDGELAAHEFTLETACLLDEAGPFGAQFPSPVFDNIFQVISCKPLGEGNKHVRYLLKPQGGERIVEAVHFGVSSEEWLVAGAQAQLAYTIDLNHFRGEVRLQLQVRGCFSIQ